MVAAVPVPATVQLGILSGSKGRLLQDLAAAAAAAAAAVAVAAPLLVPLV